VYVYNKAYVKEQSLDIFALSSFRLSRNNTKYIPQRGWGFLNQWWRKKTTKDCSWLFLWLCNTDIIDYTDRFSSTVIYRYAI